MTLIERVESLSKSIDVHRNMEKVASEMTGCENLIKDVDNLLTKASKIAKCSEALKQNHVEVECDPERIQKLKTSWQAIVNAKSARQELGKREDWHAVNENLDFVRQQIAKAWNGKVSAIQSNLTAVLEWPIEYDEQTEESLDEARVIDEKLQQLPTEPPSNPALVLSDAIASLERRRDLETVIRDAVPADVRNLLQSVNEDAMTLANLKAKDLKLLQDNGFAANLKVVFETAGSSDE